jgi:hypothetical protein
LQVSESGRRERCRHGSDLHWGTAPAPGGPIPKNPYRAGTNAGQTRNQVSHSPHEQCTANGLQRWWEDKPTVTTS